MPSRDHTGAVRRQVVDATAELMRGTAGGTTEADRGIGGLRLTS